MRRELLSTKREKYLKQKLDSIIYGTVNLLYIQSGLSKDTNRGVMLSWFNSRLRKIHMDFHTPEFPKDFLKDFDVRKYVSILKEANVNIVVFFTKDHYGNSYYETKVGHKHSGLKFDLFGTLLEEAHANDIKLIAYHSICWDSHAAIENPDWTQKDKEGKPILLPPTNWRFICLNTPYVQELLHPQLEEITENYDVDGFWLDIVWMHDEGCFCDYCQKRYMIENPNSKWPPKPEDLTSFKIGTTQHFLAETSRLTKRTKPEAVIGWNGGGSLGTRSLTRDMDYLTVEVHPTWHGYHYPSLMARYMHTFGKPYEMLTARFLRMWGDWSLKTTEQLKQEFATIIANGGLCSCGDQTYPEGTLEPAVYRNIGEAYAFVKEREKWCIGAEAVPYAAILTKAKLVIIGPPDESLYGAHKVLAEGHIPFSILDFEAIEKISQYKVLILPDVRMLSDSEVEAFKNFVADGGTLMATYGTSLLDEKGNFRGEFALSDLFGVNYAGPTPYSLGYMKASKRDIAENIPEMPILVLENFLKVQPRGSVTELFKLIYPLTERIPGRYATQPPFTERFVSHRHAPPGLESPYPAAVINAYGKGKVVYVSSPIFKAYWQMNLPWLRTICLNLIKRAEPEGILETNAPPSLEVCLMRQGSSTVIHLVSYHAEKRGGKVEPLMETYSEVVESIPPVRDITVRLRAVEPREVYLAPGRETLKWEAQDGCIRMLVPEVKIHQMIVLET